MFKNFTEEEIDYLYRVYEGYTDDYDHRLFIIGRYAFRVSQVVGSGSPYVIYAPDGTIITSYLGLTMWLMEKWGRVPVIKLIRTNTRYARPIQGGFPGSEPEQVTVPRSIEAQLDIQPLKTWLCVATHAHLVNHTPNAK